MARGRLQGLFIVQRNPMKCIGYSRVSTADQAREGVSLDNQESKIMTYAELNGIELVDLVRDEGISGKSLDRDGIKRVLEMAKARQIDAIIVYKLDRLSRKTLDTLNLIELFEKYGVAFHSISEKIDTESATGKFFLTIVSALSQMERDLISERTTDALSYKKEKGEWCGRVPYGFMVQDSRLVENPDQIKTIQKAKRLKRQGKSYRAISKVINLPLGTVYNIVNTNLRSMKSAYSSGLA